MIEHIRNAFKGKLGEASQWGKDLIKNLVDGIKEKWNSLRQSVSNIASQITGILSSGSSGGSSGGAARPRSVASDTPVPMNAALDNAEGEGLSLAAHTFSRAAAIQAFESAMPSIVERVSAATAQMAPVSGYSVSALPPGGGISSGDLERVLQAVVGKGGGKDIVINLTAEVDGAVLAKKMVRHVNDMTVSSGGSVLLY